MVLAARSAEAVWHLPGKLTSLSLWAVEQEEYGDTQLDWLHHAPLQLLPDGLQSARGSSKSEC